MKSWTVITGVLFALLITFSNGYPVADPDDNASGSSSEDGSKSPSVFDDEYEVDEAESKNTAVRSISSGPIDSKYGKDPSVMITQALEDASSTLGNSIKNLGNSAIQILEGTGVAAEQALGNGAKLITGVAETAAEATDTGARSIIRIANGVANSLTQGTRTLVETKTNLLKGLTGANNGLQADASSNSEAVQRQERQSYGGYSSTSSYGANSVAETPNNFVNVFSQAAANTVNFGTQLLNSLVGVAANILQGTVSTLLSLLNAKGQVVGAVVQSAPPVLASVTRTAGDVLAAKARIFGAVTQAAVSFGSQLAKTFGDTFGGLFNRINQVGGTSSGSSDSEATPTRGGLGSILAALGTRNNNGGDSTTSALGGGGGLSSLLSSLSSLSGGVRQRDVGSGGGGSGILGGVGNFAQTLINAKLNLLNGILSPFTGGRPLLNFGNRSPFGSSSSSSGYSSGSSSENNFRIQIQTTSPNPIINIGTEDSENSPRQVRFFLAPDAPKAPKLNPQSPLSTFNLIRTFSSGIFKGFVDQLNRDVQYNQKTTPPLAALFSNANINKKPTTPYSSYDNSASYPAVTTTKVNSQETQSQSQPQPQSQSIQNSKELLYSSLSNNENSFSKLLPAIFGNTNRNFKQA